MFLFVVAVFAIIGYLEIMPLLTARRIKELVLYATLFLSAFVLNLLLSLNVKLPSPAKPMDQFVKALFKFFSF